MFTSSQVTVIQADASDDKAISDVCQQALREQGRLDIFFANVSAHSTFPRHVKGFLYSGWSCTHAHTGRDIRRDVHRCYANKRSVVSARLHDPCAVSLTSISCFLAVKHASAAMKQTNVARGKSFSGGSIILTASSVFFFFYSPERRNPYLP